MSIAHHITVHAQFTTQFGYKHFVESCHNQIYLTTQIARPFPDSWPFSWLNTDLSRIHWHFQKFQKSGIPGDSSRKSHEASGVLPMRGWRETTEQFLVFRIMGWINVLNMEGSCCITQLWDLDWGGGGLFKFVECTTFFSREITATFQTPRCEKGRELKGRKGQKEWKYEDK